MGVETNPVKAGLLGSNERAAQQGSRERKSKNKARQCRSRSGTVAAASVWEEMKLFTTDKRRLGWNCMANCRSQTQPMIRRPCWESRSQRLGLTRLEARPLSAVSCLRAARVFCVLRLEADEDSQLRLQHFRILQASEVLRSDQRTRS